MALSNESAEIVNGVVESVTTVVERLQTNVIDALSDSDVQINDDNVNESVTDLVSNLEAASDALIDEINLQWMTSSEPQEGDDDFANDDE